MLASCSESNNSETGELIPNPDIDLTDLHGTWNKACSINLDIENIYKEEFLKTFGTQTDNPSVISIGYSNYSDSDCTVLPAPAEGLVLTQASNLGISPYGIYNTSEGVSAKVVEFESEYNGALKMAYIISGNTLYFALERNSKFSFDFNEPYLLNE